MWYRHLAIAVTCTACGAVNNQPPDARADAPADGPAARTYHAMVLESPTVAFGGAPECSYTVTLRETDVQIAILPSGQVTSGQVQTLYDEQITSTGCGHPPASPTTSHYTFASAAASGSGMMLTFQEKAGDKPGASLVIALSLSGGIYQAQPTFRRTDLGGVLAWTVMIPNTTLTPQ
jgi:hypothetical protein